MEIIELVLSDGYHIMQKQTDRSRQKQYTKNILSLKNSIVYISAVKYILSINLKISYKLFCAKVRNCYDCIQHPPSPLSIEKDHKLKHCWADIVYNFKLDIIFYNVLGNKTAITHLLNSRWFFFSVGC